MHVKTAIPGIMCLISLQNGDEINTILSNRHMNLVQVLTSTQSSLWVEDVSSKSDSLGHHLFIKSHFFGVVQGVTHQCGAKDVLHGLTQVRFIAYQGQSCVDIILSNLPGEGQKTERRQGFKEILSCFQIWKSNYWIPINRQYFVHSPDSWQHWPLCHWVSWQRSCSEEWLCISAAALPSPTVFYRWPSKRNQQLGLHCPTGLQKKTNPKITHTLLLNTPTSVSTTML